MRPLVGLNVLDFGQGIAGPYGAMMLADFGASVTKIEPPRGDWCRKLGSQRNDDHGTTYVAFNRNKRSLSLDLQTEKGREIALRMALDCDVIVENFRPGVMDRLGLGYASLSERNKKMIYCSVSGYGTDGPNIDLPAGDSLLQAYGGLMSVVGEETEPPMRVGNVVTDMLAGMHVFEGILLSLLNRGTSGQGGRIKINLLDTIIAFQAAPISEYLITGHLPKRVGNNHPLISPAGLIQTADMPVVIAVFDHQWKAFCREIGLQELLHDSRFETNSLRMVNRAQLMDILNTEFIRHTSAHVLEMLKRADLAGAIVNDYAALVSDPQVVHNGTILFEDDGAGGRIPYVKSPIEIAGVDVVYATPPKLGQDSQMVLEEKLGISGRDYKELEDAKVVHSAR